MRYTLFILLFVLNSSVRSQFLDKSYYLIDSLDQSKIADIDKRTIDAELKKYHNYTQDTSKLQCLIRIIEGVNDEKIWTRYNQYMLKLSLNKLKTSTGIERKYFESSWALSINNIGYYFFNYTNYLDSSLFYYEKARRINEDIKDYDNLVVSYSNIANVYQNRGNFLKAMELYNLALSYEDKVRDKTGILSSLNNLANLYLYIGDTTRALLNLKKCNILAKQTNDENMKAHLLHNIGILSKNRSYNEALEDITKGYELRVKIGDKKGTAQSLLALATMAGIKENSVLSQEYLDKAYPIIIELNNQMQLGLYYRSLGELRKSQNKKEEAVDLYLKALTIFEKAEISYDAFETTKLALSIVGDDPKYKILKLELYEKFFKYQNLLNKSAIQKMSLQVQYENQIKLNEAEYKAMQEIKDEKARSEKRKQQYTIAAILIILLITLVFSYFIFKSLKLNKEKNIEISKQKHLVEEKQKEIIDSINYAKRIQTSFLPSDADFEQIFPGSFVLYKPKDIVSGDFYWMIDSNNYTTVQENFRSIAVADCTGHGVPGAILSMLGASILNQAILDKNVMSTADLLDFLNSELKKNLRSKNSEVIRDGMDISCCIIFNDTLKMQYSGANNPCWILRGESIIELKADKQAVTAAIEENASPFKLTEFQLQKNDQLFLFTDGYADQFGGPKGKKFKYKQLEEVLIASSKMNPIEQKAYIEKRFIDWKGSLEQVDDVCIIGVRI